MHSTLLANRLSRWLAVAACGLLAAPAAQAQLSGPKAIPGDYATVAAAITDLNAQGVGGGGVTFNIAAGYAETFASPTDGAITATGTSASPIVFQKAGTGANPVLTAGVGTSTTADAIISLNGSDYVTFNGISLSDPTSNNTATMSMEFGFLLGRTGTGATLNGCNNNTIVNCTVTLQRAYTTGTTNFTPYGIFSSAGTVAVPFTALAATSATAAGQSSNNVIQSNTIQNVNGGIWLQGLADATPYANFDQNNTVGGTTSGTGNTIQNFGGTTAVTAYGVRLQYQNNVVASYNTLNNTAAGGTSAISTLYGIYLQSGTNLTSTVNNNALTLTEGAVASQLAGIYNATSGTGTLTINNNTFNITSAAGTGSFYNAYNSGTQAALSFSNNTISYTATGAATNSFYALYNSGVVSGTTTVTGNSFLNAANTVASTGTLAFFYNTNSSTGPINFQNNQWSLNRTGASGTVYGYYNGSSPTGTHNFSGNTFSNITLAGTSAFYGFYVLTSSSQLQNITGNAFSTITGGSGATYGMYVAYGANNSVISGNTVTNLSGTGTTYGLSTGSSFSGGNVFNNTVSGISSSGASSTVYGMYLYSTTNNVNWYNNKVYNVSESGATGLAYGMYVAGGASNTIYNNLVGNITAPASSGTNQVSGLYISGGTAVNAYFNTIYLNASSTGTDFGTSGIYASTTPTLDLRNNIVVNNSTPSGAGLTVAYRRSSTTLTSYASTSNNNLFYAGTPSATRLIFSDGTNSDQTIAAYKARVSPRDAASVSENPPFLSTTGTDATFLHISPTVATQVESGGTAISSITVDFDGDTRSATTPDIGADEGSFTPQDLSGPTITYTALGNTASTANRTLTATITDASGIATGTNAPRLYYRKGTTGAFVFVNATSVSGNDYTFALDFAALGGVAAFDVIQYYVAAQDNAPAQNLSSSPVGATGNNPPGTAFTGTPNQFFILGSLSGTYYVGTGASPAPARTYATLTAAANAYNINNLGGAVTFVLLDAAYSTNETFPIVFNANPDASAANTLTIKPNTGVTASITGSATASAVLQFNGADYITLNGSANGTTSRDLTLTSTNTGTSAVLWVASLGDAAGATNLTLTNLNLVGGSATSSTAFGVYAAGTSLSTSGTGGDNDNLTIQNNVISAAYEAIYAHGTSTGLLDGLRVTGNQMGGSTATSTVTYRGIDLLAATAPQISQNRVVGMQTTGSLNIAAIELGSNVASALVSRNYISNLRSTSTSGYGAYGVYISSTTGTTGNEISNNMISDIITDGDGTSTTYNAFGIRLAGGTGTKVYYNSVNLTGPLTNLTTSDMSAALLITTSSVTGLDLRNNVLANSITGGTGTKSYALYATVAASFGTVNYNDYYVSGANGVLAYVAGDKATLADLRTATGQDANSVSGNPLFASATDLHTTSVDLNNLGTPLTGVTIDYDAETRSTTTPDIGADEFTLPLTPDLAAVALVSPATSTSCYGTAEAVTVTIRTVGGATIDFAANPATVSVVVTPPTGPAQTFTTTVTSGTLASGATLNVTLPGTLNMATAGTYAFAVTATAAGDANTTNDALAPAATRTVVAPTAGTLAVSTSAICVSAPATLTLSGSANGGIQLQQSTDNVTFTNIAGATGASFTTPALTQTTYFRTLVGCNTSVATSNVVTVTVNNPLISATNSPLSICEGSTATLTATASTGSSVRFFSTATGGTPLTTAGTFTTPVLTASTTYYAEAFTGGSERVGPTSNSLNTGSGTNLTYAMVFNVTSATVLQGVYVYPTAAGVSNIQLLSSAGTVLQTYQATFVAADLNVKTFVPLNFTLPVGTGLQLQLNSTGSTASLYRNTGGAVYPYTSPSGQVSITGNTFSSGAAYYYYFYDWVLSNECVGAARTAIQVNVGATPTAALPAATAASCGNSPFQLAGTVGGSATGGTYTSTGTGTFLPNANTLGATYTPSAADVAAGSVTITLTSTGGPCTAVTAQEVVSFTTPAVATFSYPAATTYCAGSTSTVTPTVTGTAGTFSSAAGLSIDPVTGIISLANSTAGTYTVTNTVAASGPCAAVTATATVTITPATSATFNYGGGTFCVTGTNPTATVTGTTGGTFSSTAGLSIDATTGAITLSASTPGTYTVTYAVAGPCGSSSTQSVTITTAPLASFSYGTGTSTFCVSGAATPTPSFGTGASAGTFSSTAGLSLNATTGAITLATSTPGTYTVTNTIAASGGCAAATATAQVTITAAPQATFSYATTAGCVGSASAVTPTLGTGATAGTFSSTTGLTLNATTGVINLATSTAGTYTVTNTVAAAGGCAAATATATFTVNPRPATPTISAAYNGTVTTLTSSAPTGNQFYLNGVLIAGAAGQTYVVNGTPAQLGSYTVTTTNANGCVSLPSAPLVVTSAKNSIAGASLRVFPNPTPNGEVTLELTGYRLATQLTVLDPLGRVITTELLPANAGTATHPLHLTGVATGVYLLRLSNADGVETRRLVRE